MITKIKSFLNVLLKTPKRKIAFLVFIILLVLGWKNFFGSKSTTPQYQTALVEKGTLINNVSASGIITSGNNTSLTTKVSGTVKSVYVTNGDTVAKGQKIADVTLDEYAQERQTAAWVAYLDATVAVKDAQTAKVTADINMWKARETLLNSETDVNNNKGDTSGLRQVVIKTLAQSRLAFSSAELSYQIADSDIANARAKVSAALRNYQENSAIIISPSSGIISDLALAPGLTIAASSSTSNTSGATIVSSQTIGKIGSTVSQLIATVNLSQMDIIKVKPNQKVTLTLDAYSDKTFTGKILSVNTNGSVSSGVSSYPVTILLDSNPVNIFPNMSVNAEIIISVKPDVLLVPSTAIQTSNSQTTVRVLKNGKVENITVEAGSSNDTQTEIVSGLNEGDTIVTSIVLPSTTTGTGTRTGTTSSPFSSFGGGLGGGAARTFQGGGR